MPIARMADHLMDLMDIIVSGLLDSKPVPLISPAILSDWMKENEGNKRRNPLHLIKEMKVLISKSTGLAPEETADLLESLHILEEEILLPHPRKAIIQGMLSNLQSCSELSTELEELTGLASSFSQNSCLFR